MSNYTTKKEIIDYIYNTFNTTYTKVQLNYSGKERTLYINDSKAKEIIDEVIAQFGIINITLINNYINY